MIATRPLPVVSIRAGPGGPSLLDHRERASVLGARAFRKLAELGPVRLDGDRVVESGTHDELVAAGGTCARLMARQEDQSGVASA